MTIRKDMNYAIVYLGAPYGDNEGGHIVSCHKTLTTAEKAFDKAFAGTTGVLNNCIIILDIPYGRGPNGETAREYFTN